MPSLRSDPSILDASSDPLSSGVLLSSSALRELDAQVSVLSSPERLPSSELLPSSEACTSLLPPSSDPVASSVDSGSAGCPLAAVGLPRISFSRCCTSGSGVGDRINSSPLPLTAMPSKRAGGASWVASAVLLRALIPCPSASLFILTPAWGICLDAEALALRGFGESGVPDDEPAVALVFATGWP